MPPKKRRTRKKGGRFTPLIWLASGALIAFFISYSGSFRNIKLPSFPKFAANGTNAAAVLTNLLPPPPVLPPKTNVALPPATNIPVRTNAAPAAAMIPVKVYLAVQRGRDMTLVERTVQIPRGQSVLKDTLEALVRYRPPELVNMVPLAAVVRKVWITGDVAYVDFSEQFGYNSYGMTGYKIQVYQVVYTATQFEKVKAVFFYIDGRPADYLGGDGYPLHNPVYPFSSLPKFPIE